MLAFRTSEKCVFSILALLSQSLYAFGDLISSSQFQMIVSPTVDQLNPRELEIIQDETASSLMIWQDEGASVEADEKYIELKIVFEEPLFDGEVELTNLRFYALATLSSSIEVEGDRAQKQQTLDQLISDAFSNLDFKEHLVLNVQELSSQDTPLLQGIRTIAGFIIYSPSSAPSDSPVVVTGTVQGLTLLDILLIVMSSAIFFGILYMVIQHHIDQGYFENQRIRAANAPISHLTASESFSAAAVRSEPIRVLPQDLRSPKDDSETPSTPSTIESIMREEDPDFMIQSVSTPKRKGIGTDIKSFLRSIPAASTFEHRESNESLSDAISHTTYIYREELPSFVKPASNSFPPSSQDDTMDNQSVQEGRMSVIKIPSPGSEITTGNCSGAISSNTAEKKLSVIEEDVEPDDSMGNNSVTAIPTESGQNEGIRKAAELPAVHLLINSGFTSQIDQSIAVKGEYDSTTLFGQTTPSSTFGGTIHAPSSLTEKLTSTSKAGDDTPSLCSEVENEPVAKEDTVTSPDGDVTKSSAKQGQILVETVTSLSSEDVPPLSILAESFDSDWFHEEIKKSYAKDQSLSRYSNNEDVSERSSSSEDIFGVDVDAAASAAGNSQKSKASSSSAIAEWMKSIQVKGRASTGSKTSAMSHSASLSHEHNTSSDPEDSSESLSSDSSSSMYDSSSSELSSLDHQSLEQSTLTTSSTLNSNQSKNSQKSQRSTGKISRRRLPPSTTNGRAEV